MKVTVNNSKIRVGDGNTMHREERVDLDLDLVRVKIQNCRQQLTSGSHLEEKKRPGNNHKIASY
jgi:hypothetical protein